MSFLDLLKIEFMKVKRSKIAPLIFIAPLLVVVSGVANLSNYWLRIRRCGSPTRTVTAVISFPALSMTLQQKLPTPLFRFRCFRSCRARL